MRRFDHSLGLSLAVGLLILNTSARSQADDAKPIDLLQLTNVHVEAGTDAAGGFDHVKALTDQDLGTVARADAHGNPVDVVFGFGGKMVAPERVSLRLPQRALDTDGTARVEILASTVSPRAGFVSLRTDPLERTADLQEFAFPPAGAQWIMLRFTPADNARSVAVAEVSVFGHEGAPASHYQFKETPAKALDVLARLRTTTHLDVAISPDEASLFADVKDGAFHKWTFEEAALLASGVVDAAKRKTYLEKLDTLQADAAKATARENDPLNKARLLFRLLHARSGPFSGGYVAQQTDLSTVLDESTFNCVSSAILYNILAHRLGLDVRAIEVPDHVFAVCYHRIIHLDVETTTAAGFNPARDPVALERIHDTTGFRYIPDRHHDERREVGDPGLVALIYYNHGVGLAREKRYHEALLAYFRAMSLDSEFASAVKNALATLANWSADLAREEKFQTAADVLTTGLALAPKDAALLHNSRAVWGQWAESESKAGHDDEALAILRKADAALPDANFPTMQAWIFLRRGDALAKASEWEKALATVEPALIKVDEAPRKDLRDWAAAIPLRWSHAELDQNHFEKAVDILASARQKSPADDRLTHNLVYTIQEWARSVDARDGEEAARTLLLAQRKRFPEIAGVSEVASSFALRTVIKLRDTQQFAESLAAIDRNRELVKDNDSLIQVTLSTYDSWAKHLTAQGKWEGAVHVYQAGLKRLPDNAHLKNNLTYTMQEWIRDANATGGIEKARTVLTDLKKQFPDDPSVDRLTLSHLQSVTESLAKEGKFSEAFAAIDADKSLVSDKDGLTKLSLGLCDRWAKECASQKKWNEAVSFYEAGLKQFPGNSHLKNNLIYTMQEWTRDAYATGGPARARSVFVDLKIRFPNYSSIDQLALNHVHSLSNSLQEAGKFAEALAIIADNRAILADKEAAETLEYVVYDRWVESLRKRGEWQEAVDVYAKALDRHPKNGHLTNNAIATWHAWAATYIDKKEWANAIKVYRDALKRFPDNGSLKNNLGYCEQKSKDS